MIFALGALAWTLALLLRAIESSGAVPPAEFAPAALVFRTAPALAGLGLVLLLLDACRRLGRDSRAAALALVAAAALVIAGAFRIELLPIGILVAAVACASRLDRQDLRLPAGAPPLRLLAALGLAVLALVPAGFLLVATEWFLKTRGAFAADLVAPGLRSDYLGAAAGFCASAILKAAVSLGRVLGLAMLAILLVGRFGPKREAPRIATVLLAAILVAEQVRILMTSLRDEVAQLALLPHLAALALVAFMLLLPLCARILAAAPTLAEIPTALAVVPGGSRPRLGLALNGLVLAAFFPLLYPKVEDYRERFFDCVALFALLFTTSLFARLGLGRLRRAWPLALTALLGGLLAFATLGQRPELRLVAFEYSRFGAFGASAPWGSFFAADEELGLERPATTAPWPLAQRGPDERPQGSGARPPILLVLWDAARPDRMSIMGYERPTTPRLAALAERLLVFTRARSSATATTLGVRNMLAGRYNSRFMLAEDHPPFLVQALCERGYDDFFVTVTDNDFNGISDEAFLRGWDSTPHAPAFHFRTYPNRDHIKPDREKTDDLLAHLAARRAERGGLEGTFVYLHLTGTHTPWRNDDPEVDFGRSALDRYDGEMAKLDHQLGRIIDFLTAAGELERTVLLLTSDHGTGLGEHGRLAGFLPYEEQLRIPLFLMVPGRSGARIDLPATNLDIAPTLVELAGGSPWPADGVSLLDLIAGESPPRPPFVAFCAFQDSYAIYDPDWRFKLHYHRSRGYEALFDLANDPQERRNVLAEEGDVAARLRAQLASFLWAGRARYGNPYHYRDWQPPR